MKLPENDDNSTPENGTLSGTYIKREWRDPMFTMAHLLTKSSSRIAVMDCGDGEICEAFATIKKHQQFIGCDRDPENIKNAQNKYDISNLQFLEMSAEDPDFKGEDIHGIVNSHNIHRMFSFGGYNENHVIQSLKKQINHLPHYGVLMIRDFAGPDTDDDIILELSDSKDIKYFREFSQSARPLESHAGQGFMIESVTNAPDAQPNVKSFQVSRKWATEFLHRVVDDDWQANLPFEYTAFSMNRMCEHLAQLGMRVYFASPIWNEDRIKDVYKNRIRLLDMDQKEMIFSPYEYIVIAQRIPDDAPAIIKERRHSLSEKSDLKLESVQDKNSGETFAQVKLKQTYDDILPWRFSSHKRLKVCVKVDVHRPLINALPRKTPNLDGKRWSGFTIEPLTVPSDIWEDRAQSIAKALSELSDNLSIDDIGTIRRETQYYPDPEVVINKKAGLSVEITQAIKPSQKAKEDLQNGVIKELDAEDILRACRVGLIPDGRLEMLINQLVQRLGIYYDEWYQYDIVIGDADPETVVSADHIEEVFESISRDAENERAYTSTDKAPDSHKHDKTVFTAENYVDGLSVSLESMDVEMYLPRYASLNTAVCLPITNDPKRQEPLVGMEQRRLPIPNRLEGKSVTTQLPSYRLPNYITNIPEARVYLAEQFKCKPDQVIPIGSSFFLYPEISPERIFPFMINNPGSGGDLTWRFARPSLAKIYFQPVVKKSSMVVFTKALNELYYGHKLFMSITPGSDIKKEAEDTLSIIPQNTKPSGSSNEPRNE